MIPYVIRVLKEKMEKIVNGSVSVYVSDYDVLYIRIDYKEIRWNYYYNNISVCLSDGLTTDKIADYCLDCYKRYIFSLYLKNL